MRHLMIILIAVVALLVFADAAPAPSVDAAPPIPVPVVTKYITTEVQTLGQDEPINLIGHLCSESKGIPMSVTVMLNNNPDWDPSFGVLRYYVVDDCSKGPSSALCTNAPKGVPGANCSVKSWPSNNDICIKGQAGQSEAVSFTVDVEISATAAMEVAHVQPRAVQGAQRLFKDLDGVLNGTVTTVYLTQIITLSASQPLGYHKSALLKFTFCPTPATGTTYEVRAVTTETDRRSSYAQYICDKTPCVVDGPNVIAHNGKQLPSNTVTTSTGKWHTLYALIVCWGGVWDPARNEYVGHFLFNANQL